MSRRSIFAVMVAAAVGAAVELVVLARMGFKK